MLKHPKSGGLSPPQAQGNEGQGVGARAPEIAVVSAEELSSIGTPAAARIL